MTSLTKLGLLAFSFALTCLSLTSAQASTYPIRVRDANHQIGVSNLEIPGLLQEGVAETAHFKVVMEKGNDAVALDGTLDGQRAATLLYHLEFAYAQALPFLKERVMGELGKIVVRLEIANNFNPMVHYLKTTGNFEPIYNNMTSIPASDDSRLEKYEPWGLELWVRPVKKVMELTALRSFDEQSGQMKQAMTEGTVTSVVTQYAQFSSAYDRFLNPDMHLQQLGVGLAVSFALPEFLGLVGRTVKKGVEFDAAMVPEVIYHEFFHLAYSRWFSINLSTPILEGYANFFALNTSGLDQVAGNLGDYGKHFSATKGKGSAHYQLQHENLEYSWEDFTPKLLIAVRDLFNPQLGTAIVMDAIKVLALSGKTPEQMRIATDLCSALKDSVRRMSPPEELDLNLLHVNEVYKNFGLTRVRAQ